ncbi:MAG: hypothetical protein A3H27_15745 [Acidobacteria bacterium RIFCSPLOWO2_02_FULL_59_13]|nr:MAG: hypothetical protein A3H27_15745 [Acidobacteria bacterium RIFCSPLOWO2_02_FULL_59_13]
MDSQFAAVFVINEAVILELIHEMTHPRPGCADHMCQGFLIDSGKHSLGPVSLAKMCQQQENPSQTLFAGVEELVNQVLFVSDVA